MRARGDTHRFGASVNEVHYPDGRCVYVKPRPVHLEFLLLDPESTVAPILNRLFPERLRFRVEVKSSWLGVAEAQPVVSASGRFIDGRSFAYWCFLAVGLGITDLHADNFGLVKRDGKLIFSVFDVETVFENIVSLTQTHLIPLKKSINRNTDSIFYLDEDELCSAIDGLIEFFSIDSAEY